jgi:hypothetical protein
MSWGLAVQFTINRDLDPDGASLRPLLEAHFRYERLHAAKSRYLHLLAIVGFWVWLGAIWPSLLPAPVENFVLMLWGVLLLIAAWASVEAWAWHRKMTHYLSQHQAKHKGSHPINLFTAP